MNIVYGFGGMRSDGDVLSFAPTIPKGWNSYSFQVLYRRSLIRVEVTHAGATLRVAEGAPIVVYGREKVLDFTYVDDCTAVLLRAIDALVERRVNQHTINLAYGQGATLLDLVNLIALALRKEPNVRYESSRSGEVTRYVADISKARQLLGYEPQTPLTGGLPKAIQWQRQIGVLRDV